MSFYIHFREDEHVPTLEEMLAALKHRAVMIGEDPDQVNIVWDIQPSKDKHMEIKDL